MNRRTDATRSARKLVGAMAALATASTVHGQTVIYVDDDAPAGGNGQSWNEAFQDLQDALWMASYIWDDVEIRIADGTYTPDRGTGIRNITFEIDHVGNVTSGVVGPGLGLLLKGAFAGVTATNPNERDTSKYKSVLSGDLLGNDLSGFVNFEDNSHRIISLESSSLDLVEFDGLVFRGANGLGAMWLRNSNVEVRDSSFIENRAINSTGGAIYAQFGDKLLVGRCFFGNNYATGVGGAVRLSNNVSQFFNCVFSGNESQSNGGAFYINGGMAWVSESTFFRNSAQNGGAVMYDSGHAPFSNSILRENNPNQFADHGSPIEVSYCNVQGGYTGPGNIDTDPLFTDPLGDDGILGTRDDNFLPRFGSPVIDAGSNDWITNQQHLDYLGQPRIVDDRFTPDTGVGTGPIVDMGAYEFQPPTCYADLDQSTGVGVLDIFDFLRFQQLYVMNDTLACQVDRSTGNNICDIFDFLAFQSEFNAGCT